MTSESSNLNPSALTIDQAARVLSAVGQRLIAVETIEADIAAGAPTNTDGTINLVAYAAWLAKEAGRGA
jgi:hypothetical protein